jgi:hypothetical protein
MWFVFVLIGVFVRDEGGRRGGRVGE